MNQADLDYYGKIVEKRPFKQLNGRISYASYTQAHLDRLKNDMKRREYEKLRFDHRIKMVKFCKDHNIPFEVSFSGYLILHDKSKVMMLLDEFGRTHLTYDTLSDAENYEHEFPTEVLETEGWRNL